MSDQAQDGQADVKDALPATDEVSKGGVFTQADIDRIVKERLERARAKYADYDDLKAKAAKLSELEQAQMGEKERLAAELESLRQKAETAEQERVAALSKADKRLIQAEVTAVAASLGFRYPGDVHRIADLSAITIDEDTGAVIGVKETLEALAKERPEYLTRVTAPKIDGESHKKDGGDELPKLSPAQERVAASMGIDPQAYAKRLAAKSNGTR